MIHASVRASPHPIAFHATCRSTYRRDLPHALAATLVSHPRCTLSELARGAGISRATLYRFAPTREAIDEALFAAGFERVEAAAAWFDQGGDARHVLEQVTATLLADWELVTLLFARMMEEQQRLGDLHLLPGAGRRSASASRPSSCGVRRPESSTSVSPRCGSRTSTGLLLRHHLVTGTRSAGAGSGSLYAAGVVPAGGDDGLTAGVSCGGAVTTPA
jgi:AcrR family transcriptional regulator